MDLIVKRITGRLVCSKCGNIFNEFFNKPSSNLTCCKDGILKRRSDDNVKTVKKRYETEASGGIKITNVKKFALTGVDRISVGELTHSSSILDLSLQI